MNLDYYFYILINNDRSPDEPSIDYFHIERIPKLEDAIEIIENINTKIYYDSISGVEYNDRLTDLLIITNDNTLLFKYKRAISISELKMICDESYDKKQITIDKKFYDNYRSKSELLTYFAKVHNREAFSCTMKYYYSDGPNYTYMRYFDKWVINGEVKYLKTPSQYRTEENHDKIFYYKNFDNPKLSEMEDHFKLNFSKIYWDKREDGKFKYYHKETKTRIITTKELIDEVKILRSENPFCDFSLVMQTVIDHNLYVEYHISELVYSKSHNINDLISENDEIVEEEDDERFFEDRSHKDYLKDTYFALTNGQSGNFEDWYENGGDIDKLMDNSGY